MLILAVAICVKTELPVRCEVRVLLGDAVEQSQRDGACSGGEDAGRNMGRDGGGWAWGWRRHNLQLISLMGHNKASMIDIKTRLYLKFLMILRLDLA